MQIADLYDIRRDLRDKAEFLRLADKRSFPENVQVRLFVIASMVEDAAGELSAIIREHKQCTPSQTT